MSVVNVGLIGYGLTGAVFHAPLIHAEKGLKLTAISTSRALGPDLAGVTRVKSGWEIISDPAIDLVVVASPNDTHASFARATLLAGKHVVVDKPFTIRLSEAEALVELAEARGQSTASKIPVRPAPKALRTCSDVNCKAIGRIQQSFYWLRKFRMRVQAVPPSAKS